MDAPFLMGGDEVENDLLLAVRALAEHIVDRARVDRRSIERETFSEVAHPLMVLIKLLSPGEGAPRDQLGHVQIAGVVGLLLALDTRPRVGGDDLTRLRLNIAEANPFVLSRLGQMGVIPARLFAK